MPIWKDVLNTTELIGHGSIPIIFLLLLSCIVFSLQPELHLLLAVCEMGYGCWRRPLSWIKHKSTRARGPLALTLPSAARIKAADQKDNCTNKPFIPDIWASDSFSFFFSRSTDIKFMNVTSRIAGNIWDRSDRRKKSLPDGLRQELSTGMSRRRRFFPTSHDKVYH